MYDIKVWNSSSFTAKNLGIQENDRVNTRKHSIAQRDSYLSTWGRAKHKRRLSCFAIAPKIYQVCKYPNIHFISINRFIKRHKTCIFIFLNRDYPYVKMAGGVSTVMSKGTADENVIATGLLFFGSNGRVNVSVANFSESDVQTESKVLIKINQVIFSPLLSLSNQHHQIKLNIVFFSWNKEK